MVLAPRLLLAVMFIALACASKPPPPPVKTAPQAGTVVDLANGFYLAMKANDVTLAGQHFSDELKQSLPPERLRETFDTLRSQLGQLRWWQPTGEYRQGDSTKLVYRLEFDRGSMSGLVTLSPGDEQITAVQFLPPG